MSNRYQYGTSPRKIEEDYNVRKKKKVKTVQNVQRSNIKISNEQKKKQIKQTFSVLAIFAVLLTISYRNSLINEKFNSIQTLKSNLEAVQKENEQLKVSIENSLNLNNIEQMAQEKLGMQKLTNKQTVYVDLDKKDYIETQSENIKIEDNNENLFQKIINFLKGL